MQKEGFLSRGRTIWWRHIVLASSRCVCFFATAHSPAPATATTGQITAPASQNRMGGKKRRSFLPSAQGNKLICSPCVVVGLYVLNCPPHYSPLFSLHKKGLESIETSSTQIPQQRDYRFPNNRFRFFPKINVNSCNFKKLSSHLRWIRCTEDREMPRQSKAHRVPHLK